MDGGVGDGRTALTNCGLRFEVGWRTEEVAMARHAVVEFLVARGVSSVLVEDLELVTSELVTNGVLHGQPGPIDVELCLSEQIMLRVTNHGPVRAIPPVVDWQPPPPMALRGRGLGIVRRLSDHVAVDGDDRSSTVTFHRRIPDGGVKG